MTTKETAIAALNKQITELGVEIPEPSRLTIDGIRAFVADPPRVWLVLLRLASMNMRGQATPTLVQEIGFPSNTSRWTITVEVPTPVRLDAAMSTQDEHELCE